MTILNLAALSSLLLYTLAAQTPPPFPGAFRFQTLSLPAYPNFIPAGLNDRGDIVGRYLDTSNQPHGLIRVANGTITLVDVPGGEGTSLTAINNNGQIVGTSYLPQNGGSRGFLRQPDGTIISRSIPGARNVTLNSINSQGRIVGAYDGHALIFEPDGSFNFFDTSPPNPPPVNRTISTTAYGINDLGQIAGSLNAFGPFYGCFIREANGTLTYPSNCRQTLGINNSGLTIADDFFGQPYVRNTLDRRVYVATPSGASPSPIAINNLNQVVTTVNGSVLLGTACEATIAPASQTISAAGGNVTVQVTTASDCTWGTGIRSSDRFGNILTPSGTGSGTFTVEVPAYTASTGNRTATLFIAGNQFTLTQSGAPCVATFNTPGTAVQSAGATASAGVTAPNGCSWTATTSTPWIQLIQPSGDGTGAVNFLAGTNPSSTGRTGSIQIGTQTFFINQAGSSCTLTAVAAANAFSAAGGTSTVVVFGPVECSFNVLSDSNWLTLPASNAAGSRTLAFNVAPNTSGNRVGILLVAGIPITIAQQGSSIAGLAFIPVTPCRLVDTRPSEGKTGAFGPPLLGAGTVRDIPVPTGSCNIPSNARAYSVNATVVPRRPLSFLTLYPAGQPRPNVSTLNAFEGQIIANAAVVPAGTNGVVSVYATDDTDLILDINGYFTDPAAAGALVFYPTTPCRLIDTRPSSGTPAGPFGPPALAAGQTRSLPMRSSSCNLPANAGAYVLNVTVVPSEPLDYIAAWPSGQPRPLVSIQNSPQGRVLANAAIVPAGTNGDISLFAPQNTDVVIDMNGYFAPAGQPGGLRFFPVDPCRVADTRTGSGFTGPQGAPILATQTSRLFQVAGLCNVATAARALSLNLTVVPPAYLGFVTLYPGPQRPLVSTLNAWEAQVAANAAILPADSTGGVNAYVSNATNVILDVNGYFAP